jgi:hypothetical protein
MGPLPLLSWCSGTAMPPAWIGRLKIDEDAKEAPKMADLWTTGGPESVDLLLGLARAYSVVLGVMLGLGVLAQRLSRGVPADH